MQGYGEFDGGWGPNARLALDVLAMRPARGIPTWMLNDMDDLLRTVDTSRVLCGTDIPIALAPGKSVEINDQYTYITPVPWLLSISDDLGTLRFTSFLYEELRAIRKAADRLRIGARRVRGIFFDNGMALLAGAAGTPPHAAGHGNA